MHLTPQWHWHVGLALTASHLTVPQGSLMTLTASPIGVCLQSATTSVSTFFKG